MRPDVGVVVVAAGRGVRLQGGEPKQFRAIGRVPMLLRALRPFLSHPEVATVVAVLPADAASAPPDWLSKLVGDRLLLAPGGPERADSVRAGIARLPPACRIVLVHDGARPFPSASVIDAVIAEARAGRAAIAALPVADTIKAAAADGRHVARTVARAGLWRAQTPQGFPRDLLERAHAAGEGSATDDAELVERLGEPVTLIPDVSTNLKVTTPDDLLLAEALAGRQ